MLFRALFSWGGGFYFAPASTSTSLLSPAFISLLSSTVFGFLSVALFTRCFIFFLCRSRFFHFFWGWCRSRLPRVRGRRPSPSSSSGVVRGAFDVFSVVRPCCRSSEKGCASPRLFPALVALQRCFVAVAVADSERRGVRASLPRRPSLSSSSFVRGIWRLRLNPFWRWRRGLRLCFVAVAVADSERRGFDPWSGGPFARNGGPWCGRLCLCPLAHVGALRVWGGLHGCAVFQGLSRRVRGRAHCPSAVVRPGCRASGPGAVGLCVGRSSLSGLSLLYGLGA